MISLKTALVFTTATILRSSTNFECPRHLCVGSFLIPASNRTLHSSKLYKLCYYTAMYQHSSDTGSLELTWFIVKFKSKNLKISTKSICFNFCPFTNLIFVKIQQEFCWANKRLKMVMCSCVTLYYKQVANLGFTTIQTIV